MAKGSSNKYEEARKQRLEENKKRFEDLGILTIAKKLNEVGSPVKKSPNRVSKPKPKRNLVVEPRRSSRARNPIPTYREEVGMDLPNMRKRWRSSSSSWGSYIARPLEELRAATEGERTRAFEAAEAIQRNLQSLTPSFVKSMVRSHVYSCFWLGLPSWFCDEHLPKTTYNMVLEDENNSEYDAVYIGSRSGLSGGWRAFALEHKLDDGDALVFQLVEANRFKIYIVKASSDLVEEDRSDTLVEEETMPTPKATKASKAASNRESQSNKNKKRRKAIECETEESESSREYLPESIIDEEGKSKGKSPIKKTRSSQKKVPKKLELPATSESKGESRIESLKAKAVIKKTKSSQQKMQKKSELITLPESNAQAETVKPKAVIKKTKSSQQKMQKKSELITLPESNAQAETVKPKAVIKKTNSSQQKMQKKSELITLPESDAEAETETVKPKAATKMSNKTRKSKEGIVSKIGDSGNTEQFPLEDNVETTEANPGKKKENVPDSDSELKKVEPNEEASKCEPRKKPAPRFFRKRA